jgi:hypothetical protein
MLVIRREQMEVFSSYMRDRLESRLAIHLERFFPDVCRQLGGSGVREAIRYGIERSGSYGMRSHQAVCKYLNLMFTFGRNFDTDPQHPWAAEILHGVAENGDERMSLLYGTALREAKGAQGFFAPAGG